MKLAACVVLYNPDFDCFERIKTYIRLADRLFVVDNSETPRGLPEEANGFDCAYFPLGENRGIAYALKLAAQKAIDEGFDYLLTMDQDSRFPSVRREEIEARFGEIENIDDYGIIGLNFNAENQEKRLMEVKYWLTSGNFIHLKNYRLIEGFKEELFIDYVDFDLCEQFAAVGKKVAYWNDLSLRHTIGNPKKYNIFGIRFTVTNHSPVRYYYRFRNARYLYRRNKKFYRKLYFKGFFSDIPKIIFFEKEKMKKLKLIKLARKDAKAGRLGKFNRV